MRRLLIFLAVILPTLALLYFSLTRNPRDLPSALTGKAVPSFELVNLEGEKISLNGAPGRPIVLNFWSTWCGSCLAEHQLLRQAVEAYEKSDVLFYSVLYEDTPENAKSFEAQYGKGAAVLLDPELRTAIDYGVSGVPETFFINREGRVIYKHAGPLTPDILYEQLGALTK